MAMIFLDHLKHGIIKFADDMETSKKCIHYYFHDPGLIFAEHGPKHKENLKKIHNTNKHLPIIVEFENYRKSPNFTNFCSIIDQELSKRFKITIEVKEHIFTIMKKIGPFLKNA